MKTASMREVQHGLTNILLWIEAGESVTITKRNKPVAEIRPLEKKPSKIKCPYFMKRLRCPSCSFSTATKNSYIFNL